jgi:hypothetical protein
MTGAHPFVLDRRAISEPVPRCQCGHPLGAAIHFRKR